MALLAVQLITDAGAVPTMTAANTSDTAPIGSGHDTFVDYKNGGASSITVTVTSNVILDNGDTGPAHVVTIAAGATASIPLRKSYDPGTGLATLTPSATASVTNACRRMS